MLQLGPNEESHAIARATNTCYVLIANAQALDEITKPLSLVQTRRTAILSGSSERTGTGPASVAKSASLQTQVGGATPSPCLVDG